MKSIEKKFEISKFDEKQLNDIKGGLDNMRIVSKENASKEGDGKALQCCNGQTSPVGK